MLLLSQAAPIGALSSTSSLHSPYFSTSNPPLLSITKLNFLHRKASSKLPKLTIAKADGASDSASPIAPKQALSTSPPPPNDTVFVTQQNVPLEGVIQFEKPNSSARINKWGRVALLSGGDVLALLVFSAIGRFSHGFPVLDFETVRTADPFIAGWFLSAYFLGGYGEDGRGMNGQSKAILAAAKSWALGIPLGIVIRSALSGHIPAYTFILVTLGSTAVLLIGWRTLLFSILPSEKIKKSDVYRKGSPFELFELLTSLVRRW